MTLITQPLKNPKRNLAYHYHLQVINSRIETVRIINQSNSVNSQKRQHSQPVRFIGVREIGSKRRQIRSNVYGCRQRE